MSVPVVFEFGGATSQGRWVLVNLLYRMAVAVGEGSLGKLLGSAFHLYPLGAVVY